jgi:hypothetical protein
MAIRQFKLQDLAKCDGLAKATRLQVGVGVACHAAGDPTLPDGTMGDMICACTFLYTWVVGPCTNACISAPTGCDVLVSGADRRRQGVVGDSGANPIFHLFPICKIVFNTPSVPEYKPYNF